MPSTKLTRRTLLRAAGAAVPLPWLEAMTPRSRTAATPPMRLGYVYFPNGVAEGSWGAEDVDDDGRLLALNAWMEPLERHRSALTLLEGVYMPRGNGHGAGTATWLTGGDWDGRTLDAGGASVDQIAARHVGGETLVPSLELSMAGVGGFAKDLSRNTVSWLSRRRPAYREADPRVAFERLFGRGGGGADRSVLDFVRDQAASLQRRLPHGDREKVDEYLESVRAVERRLDWLDRQVANGADGMDPSVAGEDAPKAGGTHTEAMGAMLDLIALAFWTDATRVVSFMMDHGQSNRYFPDLEGVDGTWHALSHYKDIDGRTEDDDGIHRWSSRRSKRSMYDKVTRWHHEQFAGLLDRLKSRKEGDGTLLDHCALVYGSNLSDGHEHGDEGLPTLIAGAGGGTLAPGRVVDEGRRLSLSSIHLGLLHRMGVPAQRFGETERAL